MTKKTVLCVLTAFLCTVSLFAGDVAAFDDLGISADDKVYLFGQYGITDKSYQGYAELYAIDIDTNDFVPGGIKKTEASKKTAGASGSAVYETLKKDNEYWLSGWNPVPVSIENTLYLRSDTKKAPTETITVTDFVHSSSSQPVLYTFTLVPFVETKGDSVQSSFYISVEKKDSSGNVTARVTAGSPDVKRKDITGYVIEKIMVTDDGNRFIIIVEKTADSAKGPVVRYMAETFTVR